MDGVPAVRDGTGKGKFGGASALFSSTMTGSRLLCVLRILAMVMVVVPHGITTESELKSPMNLDETVDAQMANNTNNISYDEKYGLTQEEVSLLYLWEHYKKSSGSERAIIVKEIRDTFTYMALLDKSIDMIGFLLFGPQSGRLIIDSVREPGQPVVDDWECYKSMVGLFEKHCGLATHYAMKRMASFANICNHLVQGAAVEEAFKVACSTKINIPNDMRI